MLSEARGSAEQEILASDNVSFFGIGLASLQSKVSHWSQPLYDGFHDNLILLVEYCRSGANETELRPAGQPASLQDFRSGSESLVRPHRMSPAHFFYASSNHSAAHID
jgi:hypothetical protein